jgi:hypothetical protein
MMFLMTPKKYASSMGWCLWHWVYHMNGLGYQLDLLIYRYNPSNLPWRLGNYEIDSWLDVPKIWCAWSMNSPGSLAQAGWNPACGRCWKWGGFRVTNASNMRFEWWIVFFLTRGFFWGSLLSATSSIFWIPFSAVGNLRNFVHQNHGGFTMSSHLSQL